MSTPKVSVLIPTYNQDAYITRAIESALAQTHPDIEVIVRDDCSPDATQEVVERFIASRKDGRVRYYRNSRNVGILRNYHDGLYESATGDWVVNLDGDDFFLDPGFIAKAIALAGATPGIRLVFADYAEYHQETGRTIEIRNGRHPAVMSDAEFFAAYARDRITWNHNSIIYRTAPARELGFYWHPDIPRNDWDSFLRLIVGSPVGFVPSVVAAWVQHATNETKRIDIEKYLRNFALIDGVASYAKSKGMPAPFVRAWHRQMLYRSTRSSCIGYLRSRDIAGMTRFLQGASRISPILPVRAALDPGLLIRAALAASPGMYAAAKSVARRLRG